MHPLRRFYSCFFDGKVYLDRPKNGVFTITELYKHNHKTIMIKGLGPIDIHTPYGCKNCNNLMKHGKKNAPNH